MTGTAAVIASEDQRFPFHAGFDFESIRQAVRHNARGGKIRGASTLTQQLARNLLMENQERFESSLRRKLRDTAHVRAQNGRNLHGSVGALVVFQHSHQGAAHSQARTI